MKLIFNWRGLLFLLLFYPFYTHASAISIEPIHVKLTPKQPVSVLKVKNDGDNAVVVRIRVVKWQQQRGQDIYEKTAELLIVPPLFTIGPHDSQIIRVALRRPPDPNTELAYRIFLQEVPSKLKNPKDGTALRTVLEIRVPVFVAPAVVRQQLGWAVSKTKNNGLRLQLINNSNIHVQVSQLSLCSGGQIKPIVTKQVFNYLLPTQMQEWILTPSSPLTSNSIKISAVTDWGDIVANTQLSSR